MRSKLSITLALVFIVFSVAGQPSKGQQSLTMPGKYVVKLAKADGSARISGLQNLASVKSFEIQKTEVVFKSITTNQKSRTGNDFSAYHYIYTDKSVDPSIVIEEIGALSTVEYVEPIYMRESHYVPNDASISSQTYLSVISAFDAWDVSKGSGDVVVAIVDSGVDYEHPDLADKIFTNENEIPNNGIDDDADGFIDNYLGWDFAGSDFANIVADKDPIAKTSNISHGTSVSGCAAGSADNGIGIAGTGFNTKYMALKMSADNDTRGANGSGFILNSTDGVIYAADHGADVINMSYGGGGFSQFEQDIFTYAALEKDVVLVASAGNGGTDITNYPAGYEHVISVAATSDTDVKASFSEHGSTIDIAAPGVNTFTTSINNGYGGASGTSFSSPIVAGAAALLRAHYPDYNQFQISQLLIRTADDISVTEPNFQIGKRLNMHRAITETPTAIRFSSVSIDDGSGELPTTSGSGFVNFSLVNELAPSSASTMISIKQQSALDVVITSQNTLSIGALETGEQAEFNAAFSFDVGDDLPFSSKLEFQLSLSDSETGFSETYTIRVVINPLDASLLSQSEIPYATVDGGDFEIDNGDFLVENITGTGFERGNSTISGKNGTASGANAWVTGLNDAAYLDNSEARLYSPLFNFSTAVGIGYEIQFKANFRFEDKWDGFIVEYTIDEGANWLKLNDEVEDGWYQTISDPLSVFGDQVPFFSGTTNGNFSTFHTDISSLAGNEKVGFRFLFLTDAAETDAGVAIDDFSIIAPESGPAVAEFSVSSAAACLDESVTFTNESTGNFSSISWEFGSDATPSTAEGIGPHMVSYSVEGSHTVKLTLEGVENGSQVNEKVDYITVIKPEVPTITSEVKSKLLVTLSASVGDDYQWYTGGVAIPGATAQMLDATKNGTYFVEVGKNSCSALSEGFVIDLILSSDLSEAEAIVIFPNPVVDRQLSIRLPKDTFLSELNMYSLSGAKMDIGTSKRTDELLIYDLKALEAGVYIVDIVLNELSSSYRVIVK